MKFSVISVGLLLSAVSTLVVGQAYVYVQEYSLIIALGVDRLFSFSSGDYVDEVLTRSEHDFDARDGADYHALRSIEEDVSRSSTC